MASGGNPVGEGLVASLARPGGNLMGVSFALSEVAARRLEVLKEAVPSVSRVALLFQMASGMVGALIVEGDFDAVPEIARAQERTLVLSQVVFDQFGTVEDFATIFPETATRFFSIKSAHRQKISHSSCPRCPGGAFSVP